MEYIEQLSENENGSALIENLYEELSYLSEHPFNLNTVTRQELERLPFLSEIQIENLLYHLYKYGAMSSIYELKNVEGLDYQTIQYLLPFVYTKTIEKAELLHAGKILSYGKNELVLRYDSWLQKKSGYRNGTEEEREKYPNRFYLGEPYYLSMRYGFNYKDRIQFSLCGEKDAGEPFWKDSHKGFDFYSFNISIKNYGIIKGLFLGDYRLSFGQGLIVNTDFVMGKTSDATHLAKKGTGIKRHFSTNETHFFRGVAASLQFGEWNWNLFASHRKLDANADSAIIKTFKTDGYHRTPGDLEKCRQATVSTFGTNLQWRKENFALGFTGIAHHFGDKKLSPELKPYTIYQLRGKEHYNIGMDYSYHRKKLLFQGEMATGKNGGWATVNHLLITPVSSLSLLLSYRNYGYDYRTLYGQAMSEGSDVQNESGFYTGIKFTLSKKWQFFLYADIFRFPWLKYGIDTPSEGKEESLQVNYNLSPSCNMSLRYKLKEKGKNRTGQTVLVLPYRQHRLRYQLHYLLLHKISLNTQVNGNRYISAQGDRSSGWSVSQGIGYKFPSQRLQLDLSIAYFDAINWENRISGYEKNILYAFSMPSYYGKGIRYFATLKWEILNYLILNVKIANSRYYNREFAGSGLEEVTENEKTDYNFSLKYKF